MFEFRSLGIATVFAASFAIASAANAQSTASAAPPVEAPSAVASPHAHFVPPVIPKIDPNAIREQMRKRALQAPAAPPPEPKEYRPTADQMRFAREYIKAVQAQDAEAMRKLIAPKALACFNDQNHEFLDQWIERQLRDTIVGKPQVTITEIDPDDLPKSHVTTLPVIPTHQINITTTLNGRDVILGRPIAYQGGRWYEIAPCPTDLGMKQLAKIKQMAAARKAKEQVIYTGLKDPMLSELKSMINAGKANDACIKLSTEMRVDRVTACQVITMLADSMNKPVKK